MTRRLPILLLCVAATAAGTARANAAWRPETPLALWKDAPAAAAPGARTNALGAAFCADTGLVPEAGPFTASALLRVDGFAAMPERMEWRNGMALCCSSGYYDGCDGAFVHKCRFARTGHGGLRLSSGSREPGRAPRAGGGVVHDCVFSRNARLALCYQPGVLLEGCGGLVAGCSFEDQPSSAIRLEGNDHAVAGCAFRRKTALLRAFWNRDAD